MPHSIDILIIGAGPAGINCAIAAKKAGLSHVIVEKGVLVNSIFNFPTNMTFFSTSKNLEIGEIPFISHTEKPTRKEALEYYRRIVETWDLNINLYEEVIEVNGSSPFSVTTSKNTFEASNIIVATGFYDQPNLMNVPGEELPKVKHYYDEVHYYIGQKVIVVGAANSACDVALECWQKGADVTMIVRQSSLYERVKYWILPNIQNRIKEGSIRAYFNSNVKEIKESLVVVDTPDGTKELENDYVLAMTGYRPDYIFLKKLGLGIANDKYQTPIYNEDTLETTTKGVYISGVINGGLKTNRFFIENTRDQGIKIIEHVRNK